MINRNQIIENLIKEKKELIKKIGELEYDIKSSNVIQYLLNDVEELTRIYNILNK